MEFYTKKSYFCQENRGNMSYFDWFVKHRHKHASLVAHLHQQGLTQKEIIRYFDFENMVENEPTFCLLYANKQKCHEMKHLNCYLCACPHFRFQDEGIKKEEGIVIKSVCAVNSAKSALFIHEGIGHLDCSACILPHTKAFIEKHFDRDWEKIMQACLTSPREFLRR